VAASIFLRYAEGARRERASSKMWAGVRRPEFAVLSGGPVVRTGPSGAGAVRGSAGREGLMPVSNRFDGCVGCGTVTWTVKVECVGCLTACARVLRPVSCPRNLYSIAHVPRASLVLCTFLTPHARRRSFLPSWPETVPICHRGSGDVNSDVVPEPDGGSVNWSPPVSEPYGGHFADGADPRPGELARPTHDADATMTGPRLMPG